MNNHNAAPVMIWSFVAFLFLPFLVAGFDVGFAMQSGDVFRLEIWNNFWTLAVLVVLIASMIEMWRAGPFWRAFSRVDWLVTAGLVVLSVAQSRTVTASPAAADLQLQRVLLALALGVAAWFATRTYGTRFTTPVYVALFLGVVLVAPLILYSVYFQPENHGQGLEFSWRVPGFGAVRLFGMVQEVGIAVGIGLLAMRPGRLYSGLLLAGLVVLWTMLVWSGGRGAVLSLLAAAVVASVVYPRFAVRLWLVLLVTGLAGSGLSLIIWIPEEGGFGLLNMIQKSTKSGADAISGSRLIRWQAAIDLIRQAPFSGHGLGQFSNLWDHYAIADAKDGISGPFHAYFLAYRNVHNLVFEALVAWGLIGGLLFLALLVKAWVTAVIRIKTATPSERFPAFLGLNALLAHSLLSGVYAVPHPLFYLAILFGICLAPPANAASRTIHAKAE